MRKVINEHKEDLLVLRYNFEENYSSYISPESIPHDLKYLIIKDFPALTIFEMKKNKSAYKNQINKFENFKKQLRKFYMDKKKKTNVIFYWNDCFMNDVFYLNMLMPFIFEKNTTEIK
jgi:hypothetical protein